MVISGQCLQTNLSRPALQAGERRAGSAKAVRRVVRKWGILQLTPITFATYCVGH
jgi:hypothetical protein